ncbi:hypothetical protein C8Q79DRAFT_1012673 [Trametes meyenii]|nr:hypothetical protein C8Q79DRAFT_1012673 [Trametes meyenii]
MYGITLLSIALVAGQAAASAIGARSPLASLLRTRQAGFDPSTIPSQCQSDCSDIISAVNSQTCSTDISCICSSSASNGLYTCLQCALNLAPSQSTLTQAQGSYDDYADACEDGGVNISEKTLTIPGGSSATGGQVTISNTAASTRTSAGAPAGTRSASSGVQATESSDSDLPTTTDTSSSSGGATRGGNGAGASAAVHSAGIVGVVGAVVFALAL